MNKTVKRNIGNKKLYKEDIRIIEEIINQFKDLYYISISLKVDSNNTYVLKPDMFKSEIDNCKSFLYLYISFSKEIKYSPFYEIEISCSGAFSTPKWLVTESRDSNDVALEKDILYIENYIIKNCKCHGKCKDSIAYFIVFSPLIILFTLSFIYNEYASFLIPLAYGYFIIFWFPIQYLREKIGVYKNMEKKDSFLKKHYADIIINIIIGAIFLVIGLLL